MLAGRRPLCLACIYFGGWRNDENPFTDVLSSRVAGIGHRGVGAHALGTEGPVPRPAKPETPPNPEELKVRPDAEGKLVKLTFNGQPWPAVLEWLAQISNMSLDWQELPGDYLNLATQRSYTVREVRDLINCHLLARGFTLLCHGEMLTVADIKKLDPSLVPRVEPKDLDTARSARVCQGVVRAGLALGRKGRERTQADAEPQRDKSPPCRTSIGSRPWMRWPTCAKSTPC